MAEPARCRASGRSLGLTGRSWYIEYVHDFKRLVVWQRAYALSRDLIPLTGRFVGPARFALGDQIARAAISVPSNIAEGAGRASTRDFQRFLTIALGSSFELETQIMLARDLALVPDKTAAHYLTELGEIQRMLHGLRSNARP